ncbi:MAG TPA: hypothetical protein VGO53_16220 [Steroidobacteraceae bacterium]|nr:hypothetical protein [Steroidobacteraceae bacterium]
MELIAKNAYAAYGAVTDHKNYQGLPMPEWENLTPKIREAWVAAAVNVWDAATATPKGIE